MDTDTTQNIQENYSLDNAKELKIYTFPHSMLAKKATAVDKFDEKLRELIHNMLDTMYKAPGIGLAAPQIGSSSRFFVIDVDYDKEEKTAADGSTQYEYSNFNPQVFINPTILSKSEEIITQEGCLSLPEIFEEVKRAKIITLRYFDLNGSEREMTANDLLAVCIQHENDHLDGKVFLDRLSILKRNFYKKKLIKEKRR